MFLRFHFLWVLQSLVVFSCFGLWKQSSWMMFPIIQEDFLTTLIFFPRTLYCLFCWIKKLLQNSSCYFLFMFKIGDLKIRDIQLQMISSLNDFFFWFCFLFLFVQTRWRVRSLVQNPMDECVKSNEDDLTAWFIMLLLLLLLLL